MSDNAGRRFPRRGLYLATLLLALLWLGLGLFRPVYVYDDGIPVVGALRVLDGQLPLRDFYTNYSPGQFYLTAAAFRLFGISLLVQRLLSIVVRALIVVAAAALLGRLVRRPWLVAGAGLVLLWIGFFGVFGYPGFPALLCGLCCVGATTRAIDPDAAARAPLWWFGAGASAGLTTLVRQDFGVYVVAAALVVFAASLAARGRRGAAELPRRLIGIACFAGGLGLVVLPPAMLFAKLLGWKRLFHDLYVWPYELTREYRGLPWPWPWQLPRSAGGRPGLVAWGEALPFSVLPLVYLGIAVDLLRRALRGLGTLDRGDWLRFHLWLLGLFLINQARIRSDLIHLAPTWIVALLLLVTLVQRWVDAAPRRPAGRAAWAGALLLLLCLPPLVGLARDSLPSLLARPRPEQTLPRAGAIALPGDQVAAVRYVAARTAPDEPIFVGTARHDRVVFNDVLFYFLVERPIATRHHHFDPGLTTSAEVQREIVGELEREQVRYIVLFAGAERRREPNRSAAPQATELDRYLRERFAFEKRFGDYAIYRRSSFARPS